MPLAGIRLFFKTWTSRFLQAEQKSQNELIMFQLDRKSVFTSRNGEFNQEQVSIRQKNCFHFQEYQKNRRKWLPIAVIRVLNRLFYDLYNSFH